MGHEALLTTSMNIRKSPTHHPHCIFLFCMHAFTGVKDVNSEQALAALGSGYHTK